MDQNDAILDAFEKQLAQGSPPPPELSPEQLRHRHSLRFADFKAGYLAGEAHAFTGVGEPDMSDFDQSHIGELIQGHGTWFSAELLRLMVKMDGHNLARMALVYPKHVKALQTWRLGHSYTEGDAMIEAAHEALND